MAGYNGHSKSNNACFAEFEDKYPASILAKKLKVSTQAIKYILSPCEWHHTSAKFNITDYYDGSILIAVHNNTDLDQYDTVDIEDARQILEQLKNWELKGKPQVFNNCEVEWIEWQKGYRRNYPIKHRELNCTVEFNGKSTYKIVLPDGNTIIKRAGAKGFYFRQK